MVSWFKKTFDLLGGRVSLESYIYICRTVEFPAFRRIIPEL